MSEKDERIKVMNEVLGGMKVHYFTVYMYNVCGMQFAINNFFFHVQVVFCMIIN